jgi:hypothetical protein
MKFMSRKTVENEMQIAETQSEVHKTRGINWAYMSLALIILTFIVVISGLFLIPNNTLPKLNEQSNTSGRPIEQK